MPHPRHHFLELERLRNVVHTAHAKGLDLVLSVSERAQEYHWYFAEALVGLERLTRFVTVQLGHVDVEQNQVGDRLFDCPQSEAPVRDRAHLVTLVLQHAAQNLEVGGGVVDDENVALHLVSHVAHSPRSRLRPS